MRLNSARSRNNAQQNIRCALRSPITKDPQWLSNYSSLPVARGNDVKVVQELMRHAKVSTTMEVYTHAGMDRKCVAQNKVVDVLFNRTPQQATVQ